MQSEPEEMPPEAKMRMKNIGRYKDNWIVSSGLCESIELFLPD